MRKLIYNLKGIARSLLGRHLLLNKNRILKDLHKRSDLDYIVERVNYYNALNLRGTGHFKDLQDSNKFLESGQDLQISLESKQKSTQDSNKSLESSQEKQDFMQDSSKFLDSNKFLESAEFLSYLRFAKKNTSYFFDTYEIARYFPQKLKANFAFGDVNYYLKSPSFTKSRPIAESSDLATPKHNSILLNLDKLRHFIFVKDEIPFESKIDRLFWRGGVYQKHRVEFFKKHFKNALCDIGHTGRKDISSEWIKKRVSIKGHLPYKFLLSLEGNDVASNLKWIMSSKGVAVMPEPKFETWFMEGKLIKNVHYIGIDENYENLDSQLEFFAKHKNDTKDIIANANKFVGQFLDSKRELIIALLVMEKYFYQTGQIDKCSVTL